MKTKIAGMGLLIGKEKASILITATLIDFGYGILDSSTLIMWEDGLNKLQIDLGAIAYVKNFHNKEDNENA